MEHYKDLSIITSYGELWKDIMEFEGLYQISSLGRVKSLPKHSKFHRKKVAIRKQQINKDGYCVVQLCIETKWIHKSISRLVAIHFIPNPLKKPQVNHKNRNKIDNRVDNLEWATGKENVQHSFVVGNRLTRTRNRFCKKKEILLN